MAHTSLRTEGWCLKLGRRPERSCSKRWALQKGGDGGGTLSIASPVPVFEFKICFLHCQLQAQLSSCCCRSCKYLSVLVLGIEATWKNAIAFYERCRVLGVVIIHLLSFVSV